MKRTLIIRIIIIIIIIIAIIAGAMFYFSNNKEINREIEKIETYNYFILRHDDLLGVIDKSGNILIEPQYEDVKIPNPEKPIFACYKGDDVKILNENKEEIFTKYERVEPIRLQNIASDLMYEKSVLKYEDNGKFGIIDLEGKEILKAKYDEIEGLPYKEGEFIVKEEDKYGVINMNGKTLVNSKYDNIAVDAYYTQEDGYKNAGYIISNKTDEGYRFGYVDYKGKTILQPEYNEISRITNVENKEEIYLIVARNGQYGLLKENDAIINNEYQSISYDETNNLLTLEKSKKYGVANLSGEIIVPIEYNQIDINGVSIYARNNEKTIVYDTKGKETQLSSNEVIQNTKNDNYMIKITDNNGTKYGIIGKNGEQIIEDKYNYIEYLYDNYFRVSNENSKLGVIDDKENVKIELENDSLHQIEGSNIIEAINTSEQKTMLYTKDMKKICEMSNAKVESKEDFIKIYNEEEIQYFSKEGKEMKASEAYPQNTLFAKSENNKWGFVNASGTFIVNAKYDKVTEFNEHGFAGIKENNKWGVIDSSGKVILEPTYELDENTEPYFINKYYKVEYGFGEAYYTDVQ